MTCIVVLVYKKKNKAYINYNSLDSNELYQEIHNDLKIFFVNYYLKCSAHFTFSVKRL